MLLHRSTSCCTDLLAHRMDCWPLACQCPLSLQGLLAPGSQCLLSLQGLLAHGCQCPPFLYGSLAPGLSVPAVPSRRNNFLARCSLVQSQDAATHLHVCVAPALPRGGQSFLVVNQCTMQTPNSNGRKAIMVPAADMPPAYTWLVGTCCLDVVTFSTASM